MRAFPIRSAVRGRLSILAGETWRARRDLIDEQIRRQHPADPQATLRSIPAAALFTLALIAIAMLLILVLLPLALGAASTVAARAG